MKVLKYAIIIIYSIYCCACNRHIERKIHSPEIDYEVIDSMSAIISDDTLSINVPEGKFSMYHSTFLYDDMYLYGVNSKRHNVIDIYNIKTCSFCKEITIDDKFLQDRISGIYVNSPDSIFFCQSNPNNVYLIDGDGKLLNHWTEDDLAIRIHNDDILSKYDVNFITFLGQFSPVVYNNYLIIGLDPAGVYKINKKTKRVGVYNLSNRKWLTFLSNANDVESNISNRGYTYDLEQPYILLGQNCLVISYPMDHYVYVYSLENYQLIKKIPCFSRFSPDLPYPLPLDEINSCQKGWNFRIQTPFYGAVNYHKDIKLYSRIFYHPQNLIDEYGYINDGRNRMASIIIMDDKFRMIGETVFTDGQIGVYSYLNTKKGYIVSPQLNNENDY